MALQTITTIKIGQTVITNFTSLKVVQKIHDHHTFSLDVRQDFLVEEFKSIMPVSQQLYGERISIEIKPIDGLNDPLIKSDPKNYIMQFYGIVSGVSMKKSCIDDIEESFLIEGYSTSFLLENAPESNSFTAMTLSDIVNKVKTGYNIDMQVRPFYKEIIPYTVQYNESCFAFLNRLAMRYGQYFYDNGRVLIFGDSAGVIQPNLIYGLNMHEFRYSIKLMPTSFTVVENDNRDGSYSTDNTINYRKELDGFHQNFINMSNAVYSKKTVMQLNQNAVDGQGSFTGEVYTQNKMRAVLSSLMEIDASSEVPGVTVGNTVRISGVDKQHESSYRITEIVHTCDDGGGYENHFKAVNTSDSVFSPKTNPDLIPYCGSQTAVVISNADPDGLSAVKVQMPWQKIKGQTTPYIPMVQKHGGEGRGSHWIPEIGDTVFVDFQSNNAELPIVVGTMTSRKEKSGYSTKNNDIKAIHTRSNNLLVMNDAEGSVLLQDASKSFMKIDGKRKIELNTDVFEINVKKLIINASQSTEITTNDYVLNALTRIYVLSKTMQQKISGFMNLFSGTALINSSDKIDIEAKVAKLHGSQKALLHSDKEAIVNSTGTAKIHGTEGNSLTNTAKEIEASPTDSIALATVYFRPLPSWKGEFGFDWLREKDNGLNTEPDYESIIEGGYKDGGSDLNPVDAFTNLKLKYQSIPITRKVASNTSVAEYLVPYLTLFSEEFTDTLPKTILVKPRCEAELKLLVDIEEEVDELKFDYDDTLFEIDCRILAQKTKTNGLTDPSDTIKIKCLKDLNSDKEIKIYVYPKGSTAKTSAEQLLERKLAGKIIVIKNDVTARKEEKFVLVGIETNVNDTPNRNITGIFSPAEKINLYNTLHQALIVPTVEETILDLSSNTDYQLGGKFLDGTDIKLTYMNNSGRTVKNMDLYRDCTTKFENFQDESKTLINAKYNGFFTIFKFGIASNKIDVLGAVEEIATRNVIIFTLLGVRDDSTLNHESLHGLGLCHTHRDAKPLHRRNYKYIYPNAQGSILQPIPNPRDSTDNVMCYRSVAYTTWHWQWEIINSNIIK
ncbi:type VI secretion system Vgr family protein [Flavobacterium sp. ACN6]|uniref:type VI secretion system Vgr family protein n=1 Tax=Flavobacterium sp. ACN6 TaxID=1920426 RepID=UPI000BB32815|nr:contractile injection system protein, VgrG/Pvc8 family [Flavobacterium sp. ACN6]PBJ13096.1 Phage-related baseplate assembly protein [Flavobacterium sp. ACN6]